MNSALIGYHFGGKHGLYLAVFEHLARELRARLHPTAEAVAGLLAQEPPRAAASSWTACSRSPIASSR